jgi:hypothetical protein
VKGERERKEVIGRYKKKNREEKKKKSLCIYADLFDMAGVQGDRKDTEHRMKSLAGFKYTSTVDCLRGAIINFIDAI